jgi:xylan 1,4-beta-xylosidase
MGSPADPDTGQLRRLQALTTDAPELERDVRVGKDGVLRWTVPMRGNDVVLVTFARRPAAR